MKIRNWIVAGLACGLMAGTIGCEWNSGDTEEITEVHKVEGIPPGTSYSDKLANYPIQLGTVRVVANTGLTFIDNGDGKLRTQTSAAGTIDYTTGDYTVDFGLQPIPKSLTITYKQQF